MTDVFYYEKASHDGSWKPVKADAAPIMCKSGGVSRTVNGLRRVRAVAVIQKGHQHLTLNQLAACYSPEGQFRHSN